MTTKLSELMAGLSAEDLKEVKRRSRAHLKAMADARCLDEIRHAVNKTQGDVARAMGIGQNAISQLEKRKDLQLSTLNRYVESVGFRLEVAVVSESGERVALENFRPWEQMPSKPKKSSASKRGAKPVSPLRRSNRQPMRQGAPAAKGAPRARRPPALTRK